jgi:hypothetical protein
MSPQNKQAEMCRQAQTPQGSSLINQPANNSLHFLSLYVEREERRSDTLPFSFSLSSLARLGLFLLR